MRPARESGVVRGSEIMKKVKIRKRAAAELVEGDGQRLAQPERAPEEDREIEARKA